MTTTVTDPATELWNQQFAALKARYPKVRPAIVVALHILQQDPDVSLEDAKARAQMHGQRITAASISAARRLMERADGNAPPPTRTGSKPRTARRPRTPHPKAADIDAEQTIRDLVAKLRNDSQAAADRLRAAIGDAIKLLQGALQG